MTKCPRCSGRMFREIYQEACDECKPIGARSCPSCWVTIEYSCLMCGHTVYGPRLRRKQLTDKSLISR